MTIDELRERLKDDTETFTAEETRMLIDWAVRDALNDQYNQAVIATQMQKATETATAMQASMAQLMAMYDPNITPTLEVIPLDQS